MACQCTFVSSVSFCIVIILMVEIELKTDVLGIAMCCYYKCCKIYSGHLQRVTLQHCPHPRFVDTGLSCVAFALLIGDYTARSVAWLRKKAKASSESQSCIAWALHK